MTSSYKKLQDRKMHQFVEVVRPRLRHVSTEDQTWGNRGPLVT